MSNLKKPYDGRVLPQVVFFSEPGGEWSPRPKRWRTALRMGWGWMSWGSVAAERTAARGWWRNWFWSRDGHVGDGLAVGVAQVGAIGEEGGQLALADLVGVVAQLLEQGARAPPGGGAWRSRPRSRAR